MSDDQTRSRVRMDDAWADEMERRDKQEMAERKAAGEWPFNRTATDPTSKWEEKVTRWLAGRWRFSYYGKRWCWMIQVADREHPYADHWSTGLTIWRAPWRDDA